MLGKVFADRYKLIKILGTGGMADVYLAEDIMLEKYIAIKILKKELINNRESIRYFQNEAEVISHLSHPNIVEVYDVGMAEGHPFIVMEYVEGKTLKEIIREKAPLTSTFAVYVMEGVLAALIHSHKKGIIHRDIKPHNIMINKSGEVKVMDFGIARITDQANTMTITNDIVGSVHYLSPEQASGSEITELSDVYSCGIVFYEMLTGKLPYDGQNPVSVAVNHIQGGLIPPKDIINDIPQEIENIVLKATMRDPQKRFKSALEMNIFIEKARILIEEGHVNKVKRIPVDEPDNSKSIEDLKNGNRDKEKTKDYKKIALITVAVFVVLAVVVGLLSLLNVPKKIVPTVVGLTQEEAITKLKEAGFKYKVENIASKDVEVGKVAKQNPAGSTLYSINKTVTIQVSKGLEEVAIVNVVDLSEKEAKNKLTTQGFVVEVKQEFDNDKAVGKVLNQNPAAGTKLLPGNTVTITVSKGKELTNINMPNLIGKTQSSAEETLNSNKLILGSITNKETSDYPPGQVISQSVKAGSSVMQGTAIDIVIAKEYTSKVVTLDISRTDTTKEATYTINITDSKGSRVQNASIPVGSTSVSVSLTYYGTGTAVVKDSNGTVINTINLN
ncbi:MAG: Stk1 family PASTA domain-containing Ser/Thr kinase [Fusobacteria bacterium]|nr:Stk1 family PASTA domain-containing Ser/Thr kinase [Fusobacteriota bacterium]